MNETARNYLRTKKIDTFQKLRILLFLYQHPHLKITSQELANRLHWGDSLLVEKLLVELHKVSLVTCDGNHYQLLALPEVKAQLQQLVKAFEHPLSRQELLNQLKYRPTQPAQSTLTRLNWSLN